MQDESLPKRESYTWWIVAVIVLLLVAIAIPLLVQWFTPLEVRIDLSNGTTNSIVWMCVTDGEHRSGMTNLPVTMVFKGREMIFSAKQVAPGPSVVMHWRWEYYTFSNGTISGREGVRLSGSARNSMAQSTP
ncbi:MAG: hypothetical protein FD161_4366 [Limisphaerales bacterium]|nr:MAG: hypothetical protein FD161_4366 [Limisphaerales bacterium]KAG0506979.1 MAG: hypothetical protein E1N63_3874 [Limisphaerales bacterium]TXT47197.1 MAG: hypothetical protein FD140_4270 [Limisphaerales bacterium]